MLATLAKIDSMTLDLDHIMLISRLIYLLRLLNGNNITIILVIERN